jgi:hypothetical protein
MTEFWDKPAEKSGKVLAAFLEGLPLRRNIPPRRAMLLIGRISGCFNKKM